MRNGYRLLFPLFVSFMLTGCWNQTELNEIGLITAIGIDRVEDQWKITYQIINPTAMSMGAGGTTRSASSESPVHVFSSLGPTIREAIDGSYTESARRLYYPHTDVLVLGKSVSEEGINEIIDFYWRNTYMRESVSVIVSNEQASEMVKQLVPPERLPGAAIAKILDKSDRFNGHYPSIKMYELARKLKTESHSAGVPRIESTGSPQETLESVDKLHKTSTPGKLKVTGLSVFKKDRKVGELNHDESFGISWMTGKVKISTLSIACPDTKSSKENISYHTVSSKVKVIPRKEKNGYTMQVSVKVTGKITEFNCNNPANLIAVNELEPRIEREIADYIEKGWEAVRKLHVDLPGFADHIHRKYPKDWAKMKDHWEEEEMQMLKLVVNVKANISQTGMAKKSFRQM